MCKRTCIYVLLFYYSFQHLGRPRGSAANLRTKILDFGGLDSRIILILRGGILNVHREFPGKSESTNLSRDNLSREIGRAAGFRTRASG